MNRSNFFKACFSSYLQVELNVLTNGVLGMDLNMDCVAEKKRIQESVYKDINGTPPLTIACM